VLENKRNETDLAAGGFDGLDASGAGIMGGTPGKIIREVVIAMMKTVNVFTFSSPTSS
jgi:hypothetical protein